MAIFTGIAAAITAISGWVGSLSALSAFALKTAVGIGLSLASQALAGKPKTEEQKFSINTDLQGGGALSRSFIIGRAATGGSLVWANTWGNEGGSQNAWLTQVIALSDLPVRGLVEVWVDGNKVSFNPANNNETAMGQSIPEYQKDGGNLYVKFYDGTQTAADAHLVERDSTSDRTWNINRVGNGVAYVIVRARSTKGLFSGIPSFTFVVDGIRLYDPSRDDTNGGSGPQRYGNPATWGGDGDDYPAVQAYNLMRGIYYNGNWVYGFQRMSAARLPSDNWVAQINKCRSTVFEATGLQPTYRCGGEISINAPLSTALDEILTSCQGKIAEAGGIYTIYVGEPDAPLFSIEDGDIVSTEEQDFTPFYGLSDSINGITGTYPEPLDGYVEKTAPPIIRPDLEELDGNRRLLANVQFTFVPYAEQVQRLMKSALLAALRYRKHTITLPPKFWRFAVPGETLRWTSERNGYVNKLFVIDGVSDKANLDVTVSISEWDPSDYSWSSDSEFKPPVGGALGPVLPRPRAIIDPYVEPYIIRDLQTKARRPAIRLVWDNSSENLIGVTGVQWEVRIIGANDTVLTGSTSFPARGSVILSSGILPNQTYEVRMRYIGLEGEDDNLWSGWMPVTTDNVKLGGDDIEIELGSLGEDAMSVWQTMGREIEDLWKRIEHMGQAFSLEGAVGEVRSSKLKAQAGKNSASITEERRVRVREDEALAQVISVVEANVGSNTALISAETTARVTADEAIAETIQAVRADLDGSFADGLVAFRAVAAPGDVNVRFSILARASLNDDFLESGLFIEIYTQGGILRSRIVGVANQFLISNGSNISQPVFGVVDGVVSIINARIQGAQIDNLVVGTSNIASGAVTGYNYQTLPGSTTITGTSYQTVMSVGLLHGIGTPPVDLIFSGKLASGSAQRYMSIRLISQEDGFVVYENLGIQPPGDGLSIASRPPFTFATVHFPPSGRSSTTYVIQIANSDNAGATINSAYLRALALKR